MQTRMWLLMSSLATVLSVSGIAASSADPLPRAMALPVVPVPASPDHPPMPAALTSASPQEAWTPRALSEQEKAQRAAADRALMDAVTFSSGVMGNTMFLQTELVNSKYDDIESQLDTILAKSVQDLRYELVEQDGAQFAEGNHYNPASGKFLLDAWVQARPKSAWAHYAESLRWYNDAWELRGDGFADDVPRDRLPKIHQDFENARFEIHKALKLNPKLAVAWMTLLDIDRSDAGLEEVQADYAQATQQRPASYLVATAYGTALHPNWHGSYEQQDEFGRTVAAKSDLNPRLRVLLGYSAGAKGCARCNHYDWQTGLKQYNRALAYSDDMYWLSGAGEAAVHLHRYGLAYQYYIRAASYSGYQQFEYSIHAQLLQALCDPNETALKFRAMADDARTYGGVEMLTYPRSDGDCNYHVAELPWGNEPIPPMHAMEEYNIQIELTKAAAEAKKKQ